MRHILLFRREHELMILRASVLECELDLLSSPHLNAIGRFSARRQSGWVASSLAHIALPICRARCRMLASPWLLRSAICTAASAVRLRPSNSRTRSPTSADSNSDVSLTTSLPNSTAAVSCTVDMPPSGEKDAQAASDSCAAIANPIFTGDPEPRASLMSAPRSALLLLGRHVAPQPRGSTGRNDCVPAVTSAE
jgi:hypothetical protein